MKITLKRTQEQLELVKAMASKNREVAYEAQMALAEFIGGPTHSDGVYVIADDANSVYAVDGFTAVGAAS